MANVAILFASRYGQTEKIARRVKSEMEANGHLVDLFDDEIGYPRDLGRYEKIIIGGPVYMGELPVVLRKWALVHRLQLAEKDVALFSVSLNAADARPEARENDRKLLERFCAATELRPRETKSLKGALPYTQYGLLKRWLMKRISRSAGGPTDTSRDFEMTDWDEVVEFARRCASTGAVRSEDLVKA